MNLKLPRTYKLILALVVVIAPFSWLMFTDDGQRRSDLFILHVFGGPGFNIGYDRLTPEVTQADIEEQFPKVDFVCADQPSRFGNRVCGAEIASFNGMPARQARFYYGDGRLNAMRLDYRKRYHETLVTGLTNGLGEPLRPASDALLLWQLDGGDIMLTAQEPQNEADAALLWLAPGLAAAGN